MVVSRAAGRVVGRSCGWRLGLGWVVLRGP